jgi:cryptochrome
VLPAALRAWGASRLCFEWDSEPYALARDKAAAAAARDLGCDVRCPVSHTLYDPRAVIAANGGKPPLTYTVRARSSAGELCRSRCLQDPVSA